VSIVWCEQAWLGGDGVEAGVRLAIDGGRIAEVQVGVEAPDGAETLAGVTLPGFANTHSHAFQRVLRGRTQRRRGTFWSWRDAMYEAAAALEPDAYETLATAVFGEMALAGITLVGEFHYVHHAPDGTPYADPNELGHAVARAAEAAGVRLTLLDACYLHGGIGEPVEGAQRRFADAGVDAWATRVDRLRDGDLLRVGAAAHSVRALAPDELRTVAGWAHDRGAPLHAHVSEQRAENASCLAAHGRTPAAVLHEAGCLGPRFTAVHATHVTEADIRLLGGSRSTCCLCPTTERDLGDGIGRASALAAAGAALTVGSDSNAVVDPFEEARAVELDERLASEQRVLHDPAALLEAATRNGYAALGWTGGELAAGACADLVNVGLDSTRLAGTRRDDVVPALVFAAHPADVRNVMVGGRWIVRDGAHTRLDVPAALHQAVGA
jgi:formiminoglutamate deiminase